MPDRGGSGSVLGSGGVEPTGHCAHAESMLPLSSVRGCFCQISPDLGVCVDPLLSWLLV